MTPEQRQRVEDLFDRLADASLEASRSILQSECADDPDVHSEVLRLLVGSKGTASPTAHVRRGLEEISSTLEVELNVGDRVESYELLEKIASGGMGTVYRARQDLTNQIVALKVIRPGLLSPHLVRRFMFEVEVLGRLDHVGIARIYAAGIANTALGQQPYFAMEFVQGLPLDQYARHNRLTTRQRLALYHRVAEAMNAAHERGVIHRDLKPNNILVTEAGQPKVLDFGVARATQADQPAGPALTLDTGDLIGTLPFMAPEQITSASAEIDLETDVYALGVVGFLLMTGRMPYDVVGKHLHETSRIITEQEPRRPSSIDRSLRGDVEAILLKALEKQKSRRYRSAGALAEDLRRAVNDEPIEARPISAWRRAAKFARRNRLIVATVGAVILSLAAGLIATGLALRRAERQRKIAESERENAQSVLQFFTGNVLGSAQPGERGRDVKVVEVVDDASAQLKGQFVGKPRIEAGVRQSIARTYNALGLPKQAMPHVQVALELLGPLTKENAAAVLDVRHQLGYAQQLLGDAKQCEQTWRQEIADRTAIFGADHKETLQARNDLAALLTTTDRAEEAIGILQQVYQGTLKQNGADDPATIFSEMNLYAAQEQARLDGKTLPMVKQVHERAARALGPDHPAALNVLRVASFAAGNAGDFEQAISYARMEWEGCKRAYGPAHVLTVTAGANVVANLYNLQRYDEAVVAGRENVEQSVAAFGPKHSTTLLAKHNLAGALARTGHVDEAERMARETLDLRRAVEGEHSEGAQATRRVLAVCLREQGKLADAEALFRQDFDWLLSSAGPTHPSTVTQALFLSGTLVRMGRHEEVVKTLEPIAEAAIASKQVDGARLRVCENLAGAYRATNQPEKADALLRRAGLPTTRGAATTTTTTTSSSQLCLGGRA
jgi:non-specific serine/threonine protein kinase/serine/threonine-protein kinase